MGCGSRISYIDKSLKGCLIKLGLNSTLLVVVHQSVVARIFLICVNSPVLIQCRILVIRSVD